MVDGSTVFVAAVGAVHRVIDVAQREGAAAGLPMLADRLDTLRRPRAEPGPRGGLSAMIEQVHSAMISVMATSLRHEAAGILVERLRDTSTVGEFADDPWAPLDPGASAARMDAVRSRMLVASRSALRACQHFRETGRPGYLRDAVKILESASLSEMRISGSRLTPASCDEEFARLGEALDQSIPPCAWAFLAKVLRDEAAAACRASDLRIGPKLKARFDAWFTRGAWDIDLESVPMVTGKWFVGPVQDVCDSALEREHESRRAEAARRAEQTRRFDEWTALRAADSAEDDSRVPAEDTAGEEEATDEGLADSVRRADGYVLVNLPQGPEYLHPAMAEAVLANLERDARIERQQREYEEVRREYYRKIGRPYEPPPVRYHGVD